MPNRIIDHAGIGPEAVILTLEGLLPNARTLRLPLAHLDGVVVAHRLSSFAGLKCFAAGASGDEIGLGVVALELRRLPRGDELTRVCIAGGAKHIQDQINTSANPLAIAVRLVPFRRFYIEGERLDLE